MKKLLYLFLLLAGFLVVFRALVVPLARQRQERRLQSPTLVARIPAEMDRWLLRRHFTRRIPSAFWSDSSKALEGRLVDWGLPISALRRELGLKRFWGGEWLGASSVAGDWFLAGPSSRLLVVRPELKELGPDSVLALERGHLRVDGGIFVCASRPELLAQGGWLAELPPWTERDDLLVGGDRLEFLACENGGALMAAKRVDEVLLCEGLAWDCAEGLARLRSLAPAGDAMQTVAESALDSLPYLRRGGPFDAQGRALPPLEGGARWRKDPDRIVAERAWKDGDRSAALARVILSP